MNECTFIKPPGVAVLFEVVPNQGRRDEYLDRAAALAPLLQRVDGFVSIERFASPIDPSKLLSLSFWRDEAAIAQWRNVGDHRIAQQRGRAGGFATDRLRIAHVESRLRHERSRTGAVRQPCGTRLSELRML